ncbi:snoRNA-binding rRNA-processing protein utp10 [Neocucurbitaria cava]|uniref:U3 small nucleolar RNA-associated protein 10 n=1 Tax=Neocucurbitaria cava TaxID=798079 RepID=A0A9W8YDR6_9PLEO|nr:snoRNA-binding rRNA-processing protein utp10 [Neocucurbitaria cava]
MLITVEAIFGILSNSSSGRKDLQDQKTEQLVLRVLPMLNSCMRSKHGPEAVMACYTIVIILVNQAKLGDKILDGLMEAVVLAHDETSLNECLACLAIIAKERSQAQIPEKVHKRLLRIPQLSQKLVFISKQCQVERLVMGCALGALNGVSQSDEKRSIFHELIKSRLLTDSRIQMVFQALILMLRDSEPGSEEHGQLLDLATKLVETKPLLDLLQATAKQNDVDLESLGLLMKQWIDFEPTHIADTDDEVMLDADEGVDKAAFTIQLPDISATSFLDPKPNDRFADIADAFEQAVALKQTKQFLALDALGQEDALQRTRYLSFLIRIWCSSRSVSVRVAALRAAVTAIMQSDAAHTLQNILPYVLHALADASPLVRRAAAPCVAALSEKISVASKAKAWGTSDIYASMSSKIVALTAEDASTLLSSLLKPILEECVMDSNFIIAAIRDILEGSQTSKNQPRHAIKAQVRTSILAFLASHTSLTPILRVRLCLLPIFNFHAKSSDALRSNTIIPIIRNWCTLSAIDASSKCDTEGITLEEADRGHLNALIAREAKSAQLLEELLVVGFKERTALINAAFDKITSLWSSMKSDARLALAQSLLDLSVKESSDPIDKLCRDRALETLRTVKLDSATLVTFLENVTSAVQMPEGPPAKKRRRTSRSEMARVELSSHQDVQRLLRRLTLVLELIEGSVPAHHPALFKPLFTVFADLQPLKQQSGSELVYLQSIILGCLTPIVNTLKEQPDTAEYQSAVRADLLIDCIRHSTSPQVQNSALLLIANLASWVPDLILHNLMPIFTFIGSTLLRQQDDYSAQVVDKTISRVVPQLAASLRSKHKNFLTGVSDLLLSFTAAFEHIPLHRRLKLFSELARTLGPEDSLSAIIALLADRYHNNKTQRRFSTDLLLAFDPIHTLDAIKGYLDLVTDAAGPKRKVSDTLFGLNEKQPAQVDSALRNLLASLAELATDERVRAHLTRAFRRKEEASKPREVFANIVETTIQLSKKVASSPKLYDCCSRVLAKCLDLLPTTDLIKSAELLLLNSDAQVQVAAIKSVELRAGTTVQNDRRSIPALLSFLPSVENVLQQSQGIDAKIISVSCIDRIIERFGKKDVAAVVSVAHTISGSQSLSSSDDRVRILSLLCLTSVVDVLEDEAISFLPTILPTAYDYLSHAIEEEKTGLHNAVYTLLSNIVERLGYMFSREYLETALKLSNRSAEAGLDDACDESRRGFYQSVSEHLDAQGVFAAIKSTWHHAISQGFDASLEQLELLCSTIDSQTKAKLIKASSTLFGLLLEAFHLREAIESQNEQEFEDEEVDQLDNILVEATLAMILKLNDAIFRPFFVRLVDQEGPLPSKPQRAITFYKFLAAFFDKFKVRVAIVQPNHLQTKEVSISC